jgi:hypothetical protein
VATSNVVGYYLNSGQVLTKGKALTSLNGRARLTLENDCRVTLTYYDNIRWQSGAVNATDCALTVTTDGKFVLRLPDCEYQLASSQVSSVDAIYYQILLTNNGQLEMHMTTIEASLKQYCPSKAAEPSKPAATAL